MPRSLEDVNESAFGEFRGLLLLGARTSMPFSRARGIPAGGVGGDTGVPHLGVSGPADLGSV